MSNSLRLHELQHARLLCPPLSPRVCSNLCPFSWWCHPTISLSLAAFFSCLQSFPASGSFLMNLMRHNDMPRCIFFEICHSWCWLSFLNLWLIFVINFGLSKLIRIVSHYSFLFFFSLSLAPPIECMLHFLYLPHSCWIVYSIFPLCFSLLFFSQLIVMPPQTAILLFCTYFSWEEENGKPLQYSCLKNLMNSFKMSFHSSCI